ncbi:hypothetical protein HanPI659440_Chr06g0225101 [Helianthus annuus]|nr:hypothetical protein HanPI659440_Chr06g0225101 [Helianthus annuus]
MKNSNVTHADLITNKMNVDLYMLRALMLHRIIRQVNSGDIITIDNGCLTKRSM